MATLYWGPSAGTSTGTWNSSSATNWFTDLARTTPAAAAPTSADDVVFDGSSDNGVNFNVTVGAGAVCRNLTVSNLDKQMTLTISSPMSIYGSMTLPASNFVRAGYQNITFKSTSTGNTITTGGVSFYNLFVFDGVGGSWIMQDNFTNIAGTTLTNGTLDLNNTTYTDIVITSNNSNTRSIAFGTGKFVLTGNATTVWGFNTATGFTYTGTPRVECNYSGSTGGRNIYHGSSAGGTEANTPNFYIITGSDSINMTSAKTIDFTGFSGTYANSNRTIYGNLIISSGTTVASGTGSITFAATSGTQQITTNGKTLDFPVAFNGVGGTFQLQDNCTVGSTRTVTLTNGALDLNSKTLSTGIFSSSNANTRSILFGTGDITLTGSGTNIWVTTNSSNFSYSGTPTVNCTYAGSTGTRAIFGAGTEARALNFNITAGSDTVAFQGGLYQKNIDFTGFSGVAAVQTVIVGNLVISSGMTLSSSASPLVFSGTSGVQQITTAGKTFDFPVTFSGLGGTFTFQDALTMGSGRALTFTNGTLQLKAGTTNTVGSFATSGTNQKYLQSTLAGSQATLSDASGTNSLSYTTIQDINATGGAIWNAYYANGNIDGGNNTNWNFGGTPSYDAEYGYKLRSFTETGRF